MRTLRDPFYAQILKALEDLPPEQGPLFEECMADVLESRFPGLVPITGGSDAGMDGAVPHGEGEPFPLVCTVGTDVVGNLTKSLRSSLEHGSSPTGRVVLATSRRLTPQRLRTLRERARELGFVPVQIFEQRAVANLLYRSPKWARDLLALTGEPPALSVLPRTRRPLLEVELVGRDRDLMELRKFRGDLVLLGQPGSGKTFLLHALAREGWGLFVASRDVASILNAWREQRPPRLIVDDAHANLELLTELRHARSSANASFAIVATSWPGEREAVKAAMGGTLPPKLIRQLELLTRNEILKVYERVGVVAVPEVLRWLVDQAGNKPGLAVTLGSLFLQGDWERIRNAEALENDIVFRLSELVGRNVREVLGVFAVGGDAGMRLDDVAHFLNWSRADARSIAVGLGAGGVISDVGGRLAVWPRPLRSALLRSVFFTGGYSLPYDEAFDRAPDPSAAVEALADAALLGAAVPTEDLRRRVAAHGSSDSWAALARRSIADGRWVMAEHTGRMARIAPALLQTVPEEAVFRLLVEAEAELKPSLAARSDCLKALKQWLGSPRDWRRAAERRRAVARQAVRYRERGGNSIVATRAAALALSPTMEGTSLDPGAGDRLTIEWALLPAEQLREIASLWLVVRPLFQELDGQIWAQLTNAIWSWMHPAYAARGNAVSAEQQDVMTAFSRQVLEDLAQTAHFSVGVGAELQRLGEQATAALTIKSDPTFEILFPSAAKSLDGDGQRRERNRIAVESLAESWSSRRPETVAEDLRRYEAEAAGVKHRWPRQTPLLVTRMAALVADPSAWARSFSATGLAGDLVEPFAAKAVADRAPGWTVLLAEQLHQPNTSWSALLIALQERLPQDLDVEVVENARNALPLVETMALRGELPEWRLAGLLGMDDWQLALAAAVGEWLAEPRGKVRPTLLGSWRRAVLRARSREYGDDSRVEQTQYWLGEILREDADLAFDWIKERLRDPDLPIVDDEGGTFAMAIGTLDAARRRSLIPHLPTVDALISLLPMLVGRDASVYKVVLQRSDLVQYHLCPLTGCPDAAWAGLARIAMEYGYPATEVAAASFWASHSWWGDGIDYWKKWQAGFQELAESNDRNLVQVAEYGLRLAAERVLEGERHKRERELGRG